MENKQGEIVNINWYLSEKIREQMQLLYEKIDEDVDIWDDKVYGLDRSAVKKIVSRLGGQMDLKQLKQFSKKYDQIVTLYNIEGNGIALRNKLRAFLNDYGKFLDGSF